MSFTKNEAILPHKTAQDKFLENPAYITKFFQTTENIMDRLIADEISALPSGFSTSQPQSLAGHMRGSRMTARNFLSKIIGDFIISPEDFKSFYKPGNNKHLTNFLLQTRIAVENKDGRYWRHCFDSYTADLLPFLIRVYCHIPGVPELKMKYKFARRNLLNMVIANYFGRLDCFAPTGLENTENIEEIEIRIGRDNCAALLDILDNPVAALASSSENSDKKKVSSSDKSEKVYYAEYLGADSPVYDASKFEFQADEEWKKKYTEIRFA